MKTQIDTKMVFVTPDGEMFDTVEQASFHQEGMIVGISRERTIYDLYRELRAVNTSKAEMLLEILFDD